MSIFRIFLISLTLSFFSLPSYANFFQKYEKGDIIKGELVLDKKVQIKLSEGEWEIIEFTDWVWSGWSGKYISLVKLIDNEIAEAIAVGYFDATGKYISDLNHHIYEIFFTDKYDGCYQRPEYYKLVLFHKGSTINCMVVSHSDVNKNIYNPDDKKYAYLNNTLINWIAENSIVLPKIVLSSEHVFFSRLVSSKLYTIGYSKNPKFFKGPKIQFFTEDSSEYHPLNLNKYPKHKKYIDEFLSSQSFFHKNLEEKIGMKKKQRLELAKYITHKKESESNGKLIEQLQKLNDLYKSGILSNEEFKKAKKKILK